MNSTLLRHWKDLAESWSESLLLWVIGLPKPWTATVTIGVPLAAFVIGWIVGRP